MENIKDIFQKIAPVPLPKQLVGACLYASDKDELKATQFSSYCDFVLGVEPSAPRRARVSAAWQRNDGDTTIVWATGLSFEQLCCLVRRSFLKLAAAKNGNDCLEAHLDLKRAASIAARWRVTGDLLKAAPELSQSALECFASAALLLAHMHTLESVTDLKSRAGLWRSVASAASSLLEPLASGVEDEDDDDDDRFDQVVLLQVRRYAEVCAVSCSAGVHFGEGRLASACACSQRALERAHDNDDFFDKKFLESLENEYQRYFFVKKKLGDVVSEKNYESGLLMPAVALPF